MYTCKDCGKEYENKMSYIGHCSSHSKKPRTSGKKRSKPESFYIEKESKQNSLMSKCKFCNKEFKKNNIGIHTVLCIDNPNRKETLDKIKKARFGRIPDDKSKENISNGMKKAHSEGRAWNIGKSRWNNEPSYPEKFFMKVIENEFNDKNYQREFNVGIYSIDFAWIDKKIAIEIDGQQHERFEAYKLRDQRKDLYLTENGWFIYRIKWSEFFNNTIETINTLKHIIDNNSHLNEIN